MFEAKLAEALVLKKIIDAIKDLVTDVNIDATPQGKFSHLHSLDHFKFLTFLDSCSGLSLQAMDSSHVALVSLTLG